MRRSLALIVALLALPVPAAQAADAQTRIIVQRVPGLSTAESAAMREDAGVEHVRSLRLPRTEVVTTDDAAAALARLRSDPDVAYAERDAEMHVASADTSFPEQWALWNDSGTSMDVPDAWRTTSGANVTVAVVDTGALRTHPDLLGQFDPRSRAIINDGGDYTDQNGHGTHVAGIIAAHRDNAIGTAGVAPESKLLVLRTMDAKGSGTFADVATALDYAGDQGIRIVNASLDGPYSAAVETAIRSHPGTLYVVAAGNSGDDEATSPTYPCALPEDNVLCVGASDIFDRVWASSNYGAQAVDVFAPGVTIDSTWLGGQWGFLSGTSMASANVAGEAALVLSAAPGLDAKSLKQVIKDSGDARSAFDGKSVSGRRVNAASAVMLAKTLPETDGDHDGLAAPVDACPAVAAFTPNGCPPVTSTVPAPKTTPAPKPVTTAPKPVTTAPADTDHDGRPNASDACPTVPAATANGCRVPAVRSLRLSVARHRKLTARVSADRPATISVRIERRSCRGHRCSYRRVAAKTASATRTSLAKRVKRGRYRVTVALASAAGHGGSARRTIRVR